MLPIRSGNANLDPFNNVSEVNCYAVDFFPLSPRAPPLSTPVSTYACHEVGQKALASILFRNANKNCKMYRLYLILVLG